ncbi:uncharacterized protein LOC130140161 isoform X3 [Syzygium oleosum]|uniref:uncharacterized protein LOC130140161 isoform X3 n=1 Tax=Syzygium oleosum TaxID=219896 RepID=UPI0024B8FB75|nr:uncharacterized protein LOC130140161 isoform X3 [Syzygium oleosum]
MRLHRQKKHHHRQASNTALEQLHDAMGEGDAPAVVNKLQSSYQVQWRSFWRQSAKTHRQSRAIMLLDLWRSGSPKFVGLFQVNHQDACRGSLNIASISGRQSSGGSFDF